jgi:regulator of replication initiation timing
MKSHAIFRRLRPCILAMTAFIPIESLATIKCWINHEGVRECGDVIPPEYAQQEHEEKSASGIVTRKHERSKTPEEVAAERVRREEAAHRQAAADADARRQAAADRVLLHTFSSEDDLLLARDGQLANIESQIKVTESHLEKLDRSLDQMIGEAADLERRGRKVPSRLTRNIGEVRGQIEEQKAFIAEKRAEQAQISAKFDRDLARFRELRARPPER